MCWLAKFALGLRACVRAVLEKVRGKLGRQSGQSTVEAAVMIPLMFGGLLMLLQPGILLYDRVVMENAAAEGCRALATSSPRDSDLVKEYVLRRLGAVPSQDSFHMHGEACTWQVELVGNRSTERVCVSVQTKVRPLPLLDFGLGLLGALDAQGCLTVKVRSEQPVQPDWVWGSSAGSEASLWVGAWMEQEE